MATTKHTLAKIALLFLAMGSSLNGASAQSNVVAPATPEQIQQEQTESWKAAAAVAIRGVATARLGSQGEIALPAGIAFVPLPEAARLMQSMGNRPGTNLLGIVTSTRDDQSWIASVSYLPEGFIEDGDAKEWEADALLENLKEGTESGNEDRRARGFPELDITGWIETPSYSSESHQLIWSLAAKHKGESASGEQTVNYNTYVLGREGYFSLNFITADSTIEAEKPIMRGLLAGLKFDAGKRYEDFNAGTDKVAAYGLAALVGGAVLKKAGLLAVFAAFAVKFGKLGILLLAGFGMSVFKLFWRKPKAGPEA